MKEFIKNLVVIANELDDRGMYKEAAKIDDMMVKQAIGVGDVTSIGVPMAAEGVARKVAPGFLARHLPTFAAQPKILPQFFRKLTGRGGTAAARGVATKATPVALKALPGAAKAVGAAARVAGPAAIIAELGLGVRDVYKAWTDPNAEMWGLTGTVGKATGGALGNWWGKRDPAYKATMARNKRMDENLQERKDIENFLAEGRYEDVAAYLDQNPDYVKTNARFLKRKFPEYAVTRNFMTAKEFKENFPDRRMPQVAQQQVAQAPPQHPQYAAQYPPQYPRYPQYPPQYSGGYGYY